MIKRLSQLSLLLAAMIIAILATLVMLQIFARLLDVLLSKLGLAPLGFVVPSLAEMGGYATACAMFLALSGTLLDRVHVRVNLVLNAVPVTLRKPLEWIALTLSSSLATLATYYLFNMTMKSFKYNEVSYGLLKIQLWWPQALITLGIGLLALALWQQWLLLFSQAAPDFDEPAEHLVE
ncbi:MAG: TRAP transporter small permease subunit [Gammaproteobacteria bacterium]|nr:TRAP transporter small permease subunit [Gammaproteobacteria bacterium]